MRQIFIRKLRILDIFGSIQPNRQWHRKNVQCFAEQTLCRRRDGIDSIKNGRRTAGRLTGLVIANEKRKYEELLQVIHEDEVFALRVPGYPSMRFQTAWPFEP